jgi:hypothetical protein
MNEGWKQFNWFGIAMAALITALVVTVAAVVLLRFAR